MGFNCKEFIKIIFHTSFLDNLCQPHLDIYQRLLEIGTEFTVYNTLKTIELKSKELKIN